MIRRSLIRKNMRASVTLCRWMVFGGKKVAQAEVVATIVDGEKV
jgi:hypothetical protein